MREPCALSQLRFRFELHFSTLLLFPSPTNLGAIIPDFGRIHILRSFANCTPRCGHSVMSASNGDTEDGTGLDLEQSNFGHEALACEKCRKAKLRCSKERPCCSHCRRTRNSTKQRGSKLSVDALSQSHTARTPQNERSLVLSPEQSKPYTDDLVFLPTFALIRKSDNVQIC